MPHSDPAPRSTAAPPPKALTSVLSQRRAAPKNVAPRPRPPPPPPPPPPPGICSGSALRGTGKLPASRGPARGLRHRPAASALFSAPIGPRDGEGRSPGSAAAWESAPPRPGGPPPRGRRFAAMRALCKEGTRCSRPPRPAAPKNKDCGGGKLCLVFLLDFVSNMPVLED